MDRDSVTLKGFLYTGSNMTDVAKDESCELS